MVSDQQRDDNYLEYVRFLSDSDYVQVTFDELSGGISAMHKNHQLDKQPGANGNKRGNYELRTLDAFRRKGHSFILLSESSGVGVKQYDGLLDGLPCEIKAVEQLGRWTIRTKIGNAVKQGAEIVVLFFPDAALFSTQRIQDGWKDYLDYTRPSASIPEIKLLCVVDGQILEIEKPSW